MLYFIGIVSFLCLSTPCCSQTWNDSVSLRTDTLKSYQKNHRPILDQSRPVVVNISFEMGFIQDLDEVTGRFSAMGVFSLLWKDEKLVWNPADYGGMWSQLCSPTDIWYPLLVATNSYEKIEDLVDDWMTIRVLSSGYAFFYPGVVIKSICSIDVTYYPFDTQECLITYSPWVYLPSEIKLVSSSPYAGRTYYVENGEWEIFENATYIDKLNAFAVHLRLKRKPLFAVINIVMPILLMSALNVLVFILPPEAGERVSFAVTVLLSTAVFMTLVADNLPKTSQPMSILAYFLLVNLLLSTLMCVATILNLRLYFKNESQPVPSSLESIVRIISCQRNSAPAKHETYESPVEISVVDKAANGDSLTEAPKGRSATSERSEEPITWKAVSATFDKIFVIFFIIATVTCTAVFVGILVSNRGAVEDR